MVKIRAKYIVVMHPAHIGFGKSLRHPLKVKEVQFSRRFLTLPVAEDFYRRGGFGRSTLYQETGKGKFRKLIKLAGD